METGEAAKRHVANDMFCSNKTKPGLIDGRLNRMVQKRRDGAWPVTSKPADTPRTATMQRLEAQKMSQRRQATMTLGTYFVHEKSYGTEWTTRSRQGTLRAQN